MTKCNTPSIAFSSCKGRQIQTDFNGGEITSDAGALLLRQADRKLKLTEQIARKIDDPRCPGKCHHKTVDLLRQRVYAIALGYEDLNDHDTLRKETAFQTAVNRDNELASSSTLCRFENSVNQQTLWQISATLVEAFVQSFKKPPRRLVLDFDATDDPVHGDQVGRFFHGYYDCYCFLPLYVFCGKHLLAAYLRPSLIDPARGAWGILKMLTDRFRQVWPDVKIVFRADSGFCRHRMFNWCDKNNIEYIVGIARNSRLLEQAEPFLAQAQWTYLVTGEKVRLFGDIGYAAKSWKYARRVIVKAEHGRRGRNPRFVVTNLQGDAQELYDDLYCARGEAENRIKEQQLQLFSDRTSCMNRLPNQLRVLLSAVAYTLMEAIRRLGLPGTLLSNACCETIRLKLFKIGAVVLRNTRRVRLMLSSAYPYQALFTTVAARLTPP